MGYQPNTEKPWSDLSQRWLPKRAIQFAFITLFCFQSTAFGASPSSSFGISSPFPLVAEALNWIESTTWRNLSEQRPSLPLPTPSSDQVGMMMRPIQHHHYQSAELCNKLNLTPRQKKMCVQGGEGMAETLLEAIRMSAYTCQQQFEYERWNCTLAGYSRLLTLKKAYRETAILYSFSAAGVAHAIARACSAGRLRKCHCAEADNEVETRQTWRWGGCGDNLAYGRDFATKFLDSGAKTTGKQKKKKTNGDIRQEMKAVSRALRRGRRAMTNNAVNRVTGRRGNKTPTEAAAGGPRFQPIKDSDVVGGKKQKSESQRQRINRHNNVVGMQVVEQLVNRTCKCHGVSGSCSVRTCWHQLGAFSATAAVIKSKYDSAVQVSVEIRENTSHLRPAIKKERLVAPPVTQNRAKKATDAIDGSTGVSSAVGVADRVNKKELVFQQNSPNFCTASSLGPGTTDRVCQRGDNCEILCCGRGWNIHKTTVTVPCKCKLILCCRVECQNCLVEKTVFTCK